MHMTLQTQCVAFFLSQQTQLLYSAVAQWKRAGLITLMSLDRNQAALIFLSFFLLRLHPIEENVFSVYHVARVCSPKTLATHCRFFRLRCPPLPPPLFALPFGTRFFNRAITLRANSAIFPRSGTHILPGAATPS